MRSISEVLAQTTGNVESGLSAEAVATSRRQLGRNALTSLPRESIWLKFLEKFEDPIIQILLAAAVVSMIVEAFRFSSTLAGAGFGGVALAVVGLLVSGQKQWLPPLLVVAAGALFAAALTMNHVLVEGMAVMIAVILATGVAFLSEYRSDREFEILNAQKDSALVKVVRDGHVHSVPLEDIVVGDMVVLEMGDEIPADGRIVKASEMLVDQSLMTGESEAVRKLRGTPDDRTEGPEIPGCVYRGTQVVDGGGTIIVCAVGDETYLGQIARRLSSGGDETQGAADRVKDKLTISKESTPLQEKLAKLAGTISRVGYIAAALIFLAQLGRGILRGQVFWPSTGDETLQVAGELLEYFVTMVIIIVVAVPEGLPMSVTISLALAMRKMTRANSLVRQLVACETVGSTTVICSDKTGTLTQNKMQVEHVYFPDRATARGDAEWTSLRLSGDDATSAPNAMALIAAVNSTANLDEIDGQVTAIGNSTEGALLLWLRERGIDYEKLRHNVRLLYQLHFSSERKRMTSVVEFGGKKYCLVKGATEWILERSKQLRTSTGESRPLTEETRIEVNRQIDDAARRAMRTLAFAIAELPPETPDEEDAIHALGERLEENLAFVGFVAIRDPLRPEASAAIAECRSAGISVKMITGDNVETARSIAHDVGLVERLDEPIDVPNAAVLTSRRFNELSDDELKATLANVRVVARARPLDKYRLVRLLQEMGEVVAVTGDGTNDAPALKKADVGLAMGIAGTEVAKEASKIVLLDDSFATIVKAVEWGRSLYENIQRFLQFQLTINVSALAITFLGILFFNVRAPFTVLQLLWINVIMDTFASIALCSEPPRKGLMRVPPKKRDEDILTPAMKRTIFLTAGFFVVVMLGLLLAMKGSPSQPGWLAGEGAWDVEVGPSRTQLPPEHMVVDADGELRVSSDAANPYLRGQPASATFTVRQVTLFFTIYVFFQVWNQVNCRSLSPNRSGLRGLFKNPTFLAIAGLTALGQILIVSFGGRIFKVERLSATDWLAIAAATASVVVFAEVVRRLRSGFRSRSPSTPR